MDDTTDTGGGGVFRLQPEARCAEQRGAQMKAINLSGQRFGMLTVTPKTKRESGHRKWVCLCDCGEVVWRRMDTLKTSEDRGGVCSCGCYLRKHGKRGKIPPVIKGLIGHAKRRAKRGGFDCTITSGFVWDLFDNTKTCPLLGIPIKCNGRKGSRDSSPSLDRIDPTQGYTEKNTWLVSQRANRIKNNATASEIIMVGENLSKRMDRK